MQIVEEKNISGVRGFSRIGRIQAKGNWKSLAGVSGEMFATARSEAVQALIDEAENYGADAIVDLDVSIDTVSGFDIGVAPLRRVAVTGVAIKFSLSS